MKVMKYNDATVRNDIVACARIMIKLPDMTADQVFSLIALNTLSSSDKIKCYHFEDVKIYVDEGDKFLAIERDDVLYIIWGDGMEVGESVEISILSDVYYKASNKVIIINAKIKKEFGISDIEKIIYLNNNYVFFKFQDNFTTKTTLNSIKTFSGLIMHIHNKAYKIRRIKKFNTTMIASPFFEKVGVYISFASLKYKERIYYGLLVKYEKEINIDAIKRITRTENSVTMYSELYQLYKSKSNSTSSYVCYIPAQIMFELLNTLGKKAEKKYKITVSCIKADNKSFIEIRLI